MGRDPILTSYGCACFHFDYDEDKLVEYYASYVSEDLKEQIEEERGDIISVENVLWKTLGKEKCLAVLDRMLKEHPDALSSGLIQIVLTTISLEIKYDEYPVENTIKLLRRNLEVMKRIAELNEKFDLELQYEYVEFEKDEDDLERLTIYINDFDFDPEETLEVVEIRVAEAISPFKSHLEGEPRTDLLLYP